MLQKNNRIPKTLYVGLLKKSRVFSVDGNSIRFSNTKEKTIVSVIVSNKVSKKAVQRNLIKRIFYNKIKEMAISSKIPPKAVFIYVSKEFGLFSRSKINKEVINVLNKICLFFQKG